MIVRRVLASGMFAAALLALLAPPAANAAYGEGNGRIAYSGYDGRVWTIRSDGTDAKPLQPGSYPRWSPNGTKIAFVRESETGQRIYVMNADGTGTRQVSRGGPASDVHPAWSPDGQWIAYSGSDATCDCTQIYRVKSDGSSTSRTVLARAPYGGTMEAPTYRPTGGYITYRAGHRGGVVVRPIPTGNATRITGDYAPDYSPDGRLIAASTFDRTIGTFNITYVPHDGGAVRYVARSNTDSVWSSDPAWSPDGNKIVYMREVYSLETGIVSTVTTVNKDGTGRRSLVRGMHPDWQPLR